MDDYRIRILPQGHGAPVLVTVRLSGDFAAIRRAQALAPRDRDIEVWRGEDCIFVVGGHGTGAFGCPPPNRIFES